VTIVTTTRQLLELLERARMFDDGEALDGLAHGLQCAALLAESAPDDRELQVAGLVHDLGTILEPDTPTTHAATGGDAVASLLGARVAELVANHDHAKRYLVTTDPTYGDLLSEQSVRTMGLQGGLMDERERAALEELPTFPDLLSLRRADDAAKVPGKRVPGLDAWRPVVESVAARV
jgi:predicted HD phosphohydrolase